MHRFVLLLLIFGLAQSIYAALYQFPDLTRRISERPSTPVPFQYPEVSRHVVDRTMLIGCLYQGVRYQHGDNMPTEQPCLNCTCTRATMICYLRICTTVAPTPPGCFAAREAGKCCPTIICGGRDPSSPSNTPDSSLDLRPTFQPTYEKTTDDSSTINDYSTETSSARISTKSTAVSEKPTTFDEDGGVEIDKERTTLGEITEDYSPSAHDDYSETAPTYEIIPTSEYSTVSGTTFHSSTSKGDSLIFITSAEPTPDYDMNLYNDIPAGGCYVNGTLYADGSAMLTSKFCEYCFCIRGKSTCLKPKCQLTIDDCVPRYDNNYTCCPTRYECTQKSTSIEMDDTTTLTSTTTGTTKHLDDTTHCIVGGTVYEQGALIPDHKSCHNCYCKDSSIVCQKIKCSPPLDGCTPIIPQGYCCPISYRCDYEKGHVSSNSIKGSNLNDSTIPADSKGTDIKSVKNYYISDNENKRIKTSADRESVSLLHNIVPIQRRLDENSPSESNSTVKSVANETLIQIGHRAPTESSKNIDKAMDPIRENDKTLKMELNNSGSASYPIEERTFEGALAANSRNEPSFADTVTLGSPEVHTLSIQDLFDQFFGRKKANISKTPTETSLEPKRNNSKHPSSIVEMHELDGDNAESTTMKTSSTNVQTTVKENKISNEGLSTETGDIKKHSFSSNGSELANKSSFENPNRNDTEFTETTLQEKIENTDFSFLFSENGRTRDFLGHTGSETTYPVFISSSNKDSKEDQTETGTYEEVEASTAGENFDDQDSMEARSSSHAYTTIRDLLKLKSDSTSQTHPVFPITNPRDIYNEDSKQPKPTSPDYSTTKAALIEELKSQSQTRPVVFIYDITKLVHSEKPSMHKATQSVPALHDTTTSPFSNNQKDYSDAQTESLLGETTRILIPDDSTDQSDTLDISSTVEDIYNVLKNHGNILSVSPVHITTRNQNNEDTAKTHQPNTRIFDTTKSTNYGDRIRTPQSPILFITTEEENNYDQTGILPSTMQTFLDKNINNNDQNRFKSPSSDTSTVSQYTVDKKQTLKPLTPTTATNFEKEDHLFDRNTYSRPVFSSETAKNVNSEDYLRTTEMQNTSPSLANTKYLQKVNQGQTIYTDRNTESLFTTISGGEGLSKTEIDAPTKAKLPTTKTKDGDYLLDTVSPTTETNTLKDTSTTQTSKVSTRINSKLPSFSYVETIDQKHNNASYSNYPVLTESFINAYLATQGRDNFSISEKENFTNIGSIYLGAPLAVGGTDSRKDIDDGRPKITHSGGVIFLDPKFTDIDTKPHSKESTLKDTVTASTGEQAFGDKIDKDLSNSERKKGPRNQDQSKSDQGFKIIPFVAEDAVRGQFGKLNDSLVVQPGVTEGLPDIVSDFCFIKGRIYMNGEMIGKPDPCELCRCFYGRELCQIQRCPTPPPNCVPDKVPGFCCPRYTCGNNGTSNEEMKLVGVVLPSEVSTSTTRKPDIIDQKPSTNHKQEIKFGVRVSLRDNPIQNERTPERKTVTKKMLERTTLKPEIHTVFKETTTTTKRVATSKIPETKRTTTTRMTTTTTTTAPGSLFPDPWGLLKVSGCNIYGKFFNINDQVEILSGPCSHCICTTNGVECNDIC